MVIRDYYIRITQGAFNKKGEFPSPTPDLPAQLSGVASFIAFLTSAPGASEVLESVKSTVQRATLSEMYMHHGIVVL